MVIGTKVLGKKVTREIMVCDEVCRFRRDLSEKKQKSQCSHEAMSTIPGC